jgi:hypothetical protein
MHDLRLYVKDLLTEYAQLQRFDVKPSYHARCIDWERMLTEFEWPHYSKVRPRAQTLRASAARLNTGISPPVPCAVGGTLPPAEAAVL